ncbi:MAG: hypothetical protein IIY04_04000, partial [Oscillospiraceae bacterium]|nr:hypothetical protein [Oscillospiraceae bacterium]
CYKEQTRLNDEYELSQNDPAAYRRLQRERAKKEHEAWEREQERKKAEVDAKYNHYRYKCPMCGSNKIINIEYNRKDLADFLYGVNSPLFGKTYQCDDCKYLW